MSMRPQRKKLTEDAIEQARKVISDHFSGVEVQLSGPISERDNSKVFYAVIDTAKRLEAAVKLCLVPQTQIPDESSAREQYVALERVNSALANGNPRYRVPTPLYLAADLAVFVMSWVEGESLTNKLRQSATFNDGTRWFEGIGAWLGNFHKAGPIRRQLIDLDERLKVIEDLCASPLPSESFKRALNGKEKTIYIAIVTTLATTIIATPITTTIESIVQQTIENIFADEEVKQMQKENLRLDIELKQEMLRQTFNIHRIENLLKNEKIVL